MRISKQELIEMGACRSGLKRFIKQTNNTDEKIEVSSLVGGENTYGDLLWLAGKRLGKAKIVKFAVECAKLVANLSSDKCVASAIFITEQWLADPDSVKSSELKKAAADADAAAADAAANAADAAAADADAYAAARAVCAVCADNSVKSSIDKLLAELFEGE